MRILFVSAFYPPHVIGGWEQLVQDINISMQERGHETAILTSTHGAGADQLRGDGTGVRRVLHLESDLNHYRPQAFWGYRRRVRQNIEETRRAIADFQPDVVFVHIMWNLTRGIPWVAEQLCPGRVVYYVADHWPYLPTTHEQYWLGSTRNPVTTYMKRAVAPVPMHFVRQDQRAFSLQFRHVLCVSEAIRQALAANTPIARDNLHVVHNGIDTRAFAPQTPSVATRYQPPLRLLYAGSLVPHKGVITAVEALGVLQRDGDLHSEMLTIVGSGRSDYEAYLRQRAGELGIGDAVIFRGRVPRTEMPQLFHAHDVLIFPSMWEEPLARVTQEAMAAQLVVAGTLTGGTGELLIDGETGLAFPPGDAGALADCIRRLRSDAALCRRLALAGSERVKRYFDIERMIDELEAYLQQVCTISSERVTG
ncbi:MAG: glycosyltransferase family 4 protein [Caldilineaceae bacterium]|nr:glycosyltransferase family 4 protein [Caldilineaceae bacterium]